MSPSLKTILWLAAGLGGLALASAAFVVREGESAVVHRLGAPQRVVDTPGLHFKWPAPIDAVARVDRRVHLLDPTPDEYLTGDARNVIVDAFIAWRVADPQTFLVRLRTRETAEASLESVLRASINQVINKGPLEDLVSIDTRERNLDVVAEELAAEVRRRVDEDQSGIHVELAGIKRINFPEANKNAVFERMRTDRINEAEAIRSHGRAEAAEIRTGAEREVQERLATARSEANRILGEATARSVALLAEARERFPELVELLRFAQVFAAVQGDSEFVLTSNHPLVRIFDPGFATAPAAKGKEEDKE